MHDQLDPSIERDDLAPTQRLMAIAPRCVRGFSQQDYRHSLTGDDDKGGTKMVEHASEAM